MIEAAKIKECIALYGRSGKFKAGQVGVPWGLHEQLRACITQWHVESTHMRSRDKFVSGHLLAHLHSAYRALEVEYDRLWVNYVEYAMPRLNRETRRLYGIGGRVGAPIGNATINTKGIKLLRLNWHLRSSWAPGVTLTSYQERLVAPWYEDDLQCYNVITLNGSFQVKLDQWVMSTDDDQGADGPLSCPKVLWFGQVKAIFTHTWMGEARAFLHDFWRRSVPGDNAFCSDLQAPIVKKAVHHGKVSVVPVHDVIPLNFAVVDHPTISECCVVITRSFHVLSSVGLHGPGRSY